MAAKKAPAKTKGNTVTKKVVKTAAKRATQVAVKPTAKKVMPAVKDPLTKNGLVKALMDMTTLTKKDISAVLEGLASLIESHIKPRGPGKFVMPGLMKISVIKKPATPARKGRNPFTGEDIMLKAKPARRVVKVRALSKLKEMVEQN